MTLRARTLTIIGLTVAVLIGILYTVSRTVVVGGFRDVEKDLFAGFARIEQEDTRQNVQRVVDALKFRVQSLDLKSADWAQWDDTYRFVVDHNQAFRQSNLTEEALSAVKINLMLILDRSGKIVFGMGFDLDKGEGAPVPESLAPYLRPGGLLLAHAAPDSVLAGLLPLPECPLMIVSRPIVKSDGTGPARGTLIFGRYLDDAEFQQLSAVTHLSIDRRRADDMSLPADFQEFKASLGKGDPIRVRTSSEDTVAGYTAIADLFQKPAVLLRVAIPRAIYKQGLATQGAIHERGRVILLSLVVSILCAGAVLAFVILVVLESSVLSRLGKLSSRASEIGASGDFSGRVAAEGRDEIANLAGAVNRMLEALASTHREIQVRNGEMQLLMDTVPAGLLSLDERFRINPEFSRAAARMLGNRELKARDYAEALGLVNGRGADGAKLREYLDVLSQDLIPEDSMAMLNPFEELHFGTGESSAWLRLRYYLIRRGEGLPNHILAVLEDITEEKRLAEQVTKSERENVQLKAIAEDPDLFREFLGETRRILEEIGVLASRLEPSDTSRPAVDEIFRGVHTIKGVAGSFGLHQVASAASELETSLEPLRRNGEISRRTIEQTQASLAALSEAFAEVVEQTKTILGDDAGTEGGLHLRVSSEELKRYISDIQEMAIEESLKNSMVARIKEEILRRLRALRAVPARRGLARSLKVVPGLIERLGKNAELCFDGADTPIDCDVARELNTPLLHLVRNALDHGIEPAEERVAAGKPAEGHLILSLERQNGHLAVALADDGRGIDPEELKAAAVARGVITPEEAEQLSAEQALELIFRSGFSTADEVSDVSGRGVGMDAVLDSVRNKLGGEIRVHSRPGQGTRFAITVPL